MKRFSAILSIVLLFLPTSGSCGLLDFISEEDNDVRPSLILKRVEVSEGGVTLYFREMPYRVHNSYDMSTKTLFVPRGADLRRYRISGIAKTGDLKEAALLYYHKTNEDTEQKCFLLGFEGNSALFYLSGSWASGGLIKFKEYAGNFVVKGTWPKE